MWRKAMITILNRRFGFIIHAISIISSANAASFGELCGSDADCTDTHTVCDKYLTCAAGTCNCEAGYGNSNNDGCDKSLRSYGESCDATTLCTGANQECSGGTCTCVMWYAWHVTAGECTFQTYKLLGETCGGWWQEQCLVTDAEGGECRASTSRCRCKDGYGRNTYTSCRAPQYGESCLASPACVLTFDTSSVSDDTSSADLTCHEFICQCPPSHDHHVTVLGNHLCLDPPNDPSALKSLGETCTNFNECKSWLCVKCVNATSGVCMENEDVHMDDQYNNSVGVRLEYDILVVIVALAVSMLFPVVLPVLCP